jgi:hypothetical protein
MIIFCFLTTEFQSVTFAKQTLRNHIVKLMDLAVIHRRRHMSFATVISVTKRQSCQIIRYSRRKENTARFQPV